MLGWLGLTAEGPGTSHSGPTVSAIQYAELVNAEASAGVPTGVFNVFDSLTLPSNGIGHTWAQGGISTKRASLRRRLGL